MLLALVESYRLAFVQPLCHQPDGHVRAQFANQESTLLLILVHIPPSHSPCNSTCYWSLFELVEHSSLPASLFRYFGWSAETLNTMGDPRSGMTFKLRSPL